MSIGLTRDSNSFLYIFIETFSIGFKYLNMENITLLPFFDNSIWAIKMHKKLFQSLVKPILMYSLEIWYMDFYEKILEGQLRVNKSNSLTRLTCIHIIHLCILQQNDNVKQATTSTIMCTIEL
jgi:hypothetical protein